GSSADVSVNGLTTWVLVDPNDYTPGEDAQISAGGFQAGEAVDFQVNNQTNGNTYTGWSVADGSADDLDGAVDGHIQTTWLVPDDALNSTLGLTATGETSSLTAENTFTDSPRIGSVTVSSQTGALTYGTGASVTYTV